MALTAAERAAARRNSSVGFDSNSSIAQQQQMVGQYPGGVYDPRLIGQPQPMVSHSDLPALLQALKPVRRGIGGEEITNDNPMGYAGGDPWKNGTFDNASRMSPEALHASQGNTAVNQWDALVKGPGITPQSLADARNGMPNHQAPGVVTGRTPAPEYGGTGGAGFPLGVNLDHLIKGSVTAQHPGGQVWSGFGQTVGAGPVTGVPATATPIRYTKGKNGGFLPVAQ